MAGLKVLNKGITANDNVKKIIISLPKKWRSMVTILKVSMKMNNMTLEEIISSLRIYNIELEEYEPHKKVKFVAMKSKGKPEKAKTLQAEE